MPSSASRNCRSTTVCAAANRKVIVIYSCCLLLLWSVQRALAASSAKYGEWWRRTGGNLGACESVSSYAMRKVQRARDFPYQFNFNVNVKSASLGSDVSKHSRRWLHKQSRVATDFVGIKGRVQVAPAPVAPHEPFLLRVQPQVTFATACATHTKHPSVPRITQLRS